MKLDRTSIAWLAGIAILALILLRIFFPGGGPGPYPIPYQYDGSYAPAYCNGVDCKDCYGSLKDRWDCGPRVRRAPGPAVVSSGVDWEAVLLRLLIASSIAVVISTLISSWLTGGFNDILKTPINGTVPAVAPPKIDPLPSLPDVKPLPPLPKLPPLPPLPEMPTARTAPERAAALPAEEAPAAGHFRDNGRVDSEPRHEPAEGSNGRPLDAPQPEDGHVPPPTEPIDSSLPLLFWQIVIAGALLFLLTLLLRYSG